MTRCWCDSVVKVIKDLLVDATTIEFTPQMQLNDHHFGSIKFVIGDKRIDAIDVICSMKLARPTQTFRQGIEPYFI